MKRLILIAFVLVAASSFAQDVQTDNGFVAKPYLNIGRNPSPTSLELLWQGSEATASWKVEIKTTASSSWTPTGTPESIHITAAGIQPRRLYKTNLSGLV